MLPNPKQPSDENALYAKKEGRQKGLARFSAAIVLVIDNLAFFLIGKYK